MGKQLKEEIRRILFVLFANDIPVCVSAMVQIDSDRVVLKNLTTLVILLQNKTYFRYGMLFYKIMMFK